MTNTITSTESSDRLVNLDGQTLLPPTDPRLTEIPNDSVLRFEGDVTILTGMTAAQVADAINALPKGHHGDDQPAVPGRARNLVTSAIEDGWIVDLLVGNRNVEVKFFQPVATTQTLLRDLVRRANEADRKEVGRKWQGFQSQYTTFARVVYYWDWDADAMRMDDVTEWHLSLNGPATTTSGDEYRWVGLTEGQSNSDRNYKLTWKNFTSHIHDHCPPMVASALQQEQDAAAKRAAAEAAFDNEAATPERVNLRLQLNALKSQANDREAQLEEMEFPSLKQFQPNSTGANKMAERYARFAAEHNLVQVIDRILNAEGAWDGDKMVHIDVALTSHLATLTRGLLSYASQVEVCTTDRARQDIFSTGYAIARLTPLANVNISAEVVV